ncbi:glycine cleavage system aminomethyltransferase GcvT [Chamaesiphon minutus]|uniref:Aminomethyltransferase n=1 Tax=Chamaesiphon minutus (strain ATCC 27169 / PCC 6605) TaxID=1173020 RepID=K9UK75_CHAP6|nr:glycine cleavage system aminomethyltransferase GcvT [Chamaesiphon minutus]AFY95502.1 glycine cleavage system T protein [Chamaesiphon minutus PCC 6605]
MTAPESPTPQRTPLYDRAIALNARMTAFSGWEMPVQFSGITPEHEAIRDRVGMFDISHMGKFSLQGENAIEQLQTLVPSDLSRLKPGQAQYTVLLNAQAGIIDDIIVYQEGAGTVTLIVNAGTKDKDKDWLLSHLDLTTVTFEDLSAKQALIAVQGPETVRHLQPFVDIDLSQLTNFGHSRALIFKNPAFIARTGYTGEDGFEIMVDPEIGVQLWDELLAAGVVPCGLGARDTLRLEAAMCLYGQEIDDTTTPLEAGLGWLVHLDTKGNFIGRDVLERQKSKGVSRKLVGLNMQGRFIARHDYPIAIDGERVGIVTSGTMSPTLGQAIALAYVPTEFAKLGQVIEVEIRGKLHPATVVKKPFYRSANRV